MSEREYIVSLQRDVDYEAFDAEMVATTGSGAIPNRSATITNARPGSKRNTHYMLTDAEADALRSDPRVYGVEIPPDQRDDITMVRYATQEGDFTKTTLDRGFFINWGLRRLNEETNPYTDETVTGNYDYTLDGTGVDIVIQDSGIQADHPDFNDSEGTSRVQQINWYTESGLTGSQNANHYRDYDGHGTHCAGIAAGLTYGWAKNARIYAVKVDGLEGFGDNGTGISVTDCFDVIKEWHNNKPVDPSTGFKRPTIVNMSWGYQAEFTTVSSINYRGTSYTGTDIDSTGEWVQYGLIPNWNGIVYQAPVRVSSVDTDVQEMIDAGIHVCIAAGNSFTKIDTLSGDDYDNNAVTNGGTVYYHRGSSPFDDEAHIVGNIDSTEHTGGLEQKAESSNTGPGVSIYAPGTNIMSTCSTTTRFDPDTGPYPNDTDYKITNISGTSMASPQIAGLLSLYAQLNPNATPQQAKAYLDYNAIDDQVYSTGLATDYSDYRSLLGSNNKFAFNKFNRAVKLTVGNNS